VAINISSNINNENEMANDVCESNNNENNNNIILIMCM